MMTKGVLQKLNVNAFAKGRRLNPQSKQTCKPSRKNVNKHMVWIVFNNTCIHNYRKPLNAKTCTERWCVFVMFIDTDRLWLI